MILKLENVVKNYEKTILKGISIDIKDKKSIAIIGESGCGKSTLLRLLAGIEFLDEGQIILNNEVVDKINVRKHQDRIGYVFQNHNLFPHLSLKKNITLILSKIKGYDIDKANNIADELLDRMHLKEQKDKLPKHVSGGQSARASIARALSTNPDILLLDEPTAALDPVITHEVLKAISELKDLGKDFIFVTHEINFMKSFADYFIFMNNGNIIEHGDIKNLDTPKSEMLKEFLSKVK